MDSREGRSRAERRKTPEAACSCLQLAVCTILARSIARSPLSTARSRSRTAPPRTTSPRRRSAPRTSAPVATLAALALFALFAPFAALACSITAHHPSAPEHHPSSERETARCRNWTARLLRVRSSLPTRAPPKPAAFTGAEIGALLKPAAAREIEEAATCASAKLWGRAASAALARDLGPEEAEA